MSSATYTPGPWKVSRPNSRAKWEVRGPGDTFTGVPHGIWIAGDITEGNARLIAAAPELLAALEKVEDWLEGCSTIETVRNEVRSAITKATGETA